MKKIVAFLPLLLLTGCGPFGSSVEIVEELPPVETLQSASSESEAQEAEPVCSVEDLKSCEEKAAQCVENLEDSNARLQALTASIKTQEKASGEFSTGEFKEMFLVFLQSVPQVEFPFESCGQVDIFRNKPWFDAFQSALTKKGEFFALAGRNLQVDDFFGGCSSNGGSMAFFLGAGGTGGQTEFHLLKFDTQSGTLKKAILPDGPCADCPVNFGKRRGPFIELFGEKGEKFRYFFNKNILTQDANF